MRKCLRLLWSRLAPEKNSNPKMTWAHSTRPRNCKCTQNTKFTHVCRSQWSECRKPALILLMIKANICVRLNSQAELFLNFSPTAPQRWIFDKIQLACNSPTGTFTNRNILALLALISAHENLNSIPVTMALSRISHPKKRGSRTKKCFRNR